LGVKANNRKKRKVRFFFWNGQLHKVLRISYPQNLVEAWCFSEKKTVALLYSDWKRNAGLALRTMQVGKMLNISREAIERTLHQDEIREPERSYALDGRYRYRDMWWSEANVLELHDALMNRHVGRPRKDGKITPNQKLPTTAEIKAMFRNQETLYAKTIDGTFVPMFDGPKW
jgi:hypothetical protein